MITNYFTRKCIAVSLMLHGYEQEQDIRQKLKFKLLLFGQNKDQGAFSITNLNARRKTLK